MANFFKEIKTVYETVYEMKKWTKPKIYKGGRDGKGRWYVYFFYEHPTEKKADGTPVRKQINCPTLGLNQKYKEKKEREKHFKAYRDAIEETLKRGYSPFDNEPEETTDGVTFYSAEGCLDYALNIKRLEVRETTYKDYKSRINKFKEYLKKTGKLRSPIEKITKRDVSQFLNEFEGAKHRNNVKAALASIFGILSDESYIEFNFIKEIRNKKVASKAIKIYSTEEISRIEKILTKEDMMLLMFIYFEGYMFWRPLEIVRIKRSNIDFDNKIIQVETKTKELKTKIIPNIIFESLKDFVKGKEGYIFEPENSNWNEVTESNRRDFYTKKFAKFRKKHNIPKEFKLYHFRHTFITKIYLELRKKLSVEDTIKQLSLITGHESRAIYNYIMVNDVELPEDYSHLLKIKNPSK